MKRYRKSVGTWGDRAIRCTLAAVFLFAGASKLRDIQAFAVLIDAFGILPGPLLEPVAVGLPLLEILGGIGLLLDVRGALALVAGLLAVFLAILGYGIWMGLDVDCGCFGPQDPESRGYHGLRLTFARNLLMLSGVAWLFGWRRRRRWSPCRPACSSTGKGG
jgi:uncharacterized membrane protein YphA (DoxX/SURF4 family)